MRVELIIDVFYRAIGFCLDVRLLALALGHGGRLLGLDRTLFLDGRRVIGLRLRLGVLVLLWLLDFGIFVLFIVLRLMVIHVQLPLLLEESGLFLGVVQDDSVHHRELAVAAAVSNHTIDRNVSPCRIDPRWRDPVAVDEYVLIVLAVPAVVVDVEQVLSVVSLHDQLNRRLAPNLLGIQDVYLVASLQTLHDGLLLHPPLVALDPFLPPLLLFGVALVASSMDEHLDGVIY